MGEGADEAVKVVDLEDGEGEEAAAEGSSRETRMLPRMPVRVLLAEGDDSTRHVISALLRKCGYRVAAASDGVKAWDILKEKSFNIDLVLTEVELPLMSGFLLLSTIMEHDASKNIPVIMMSSHDSVSMVFKCMLKGAADFLVKPIRKNELRNLWQHVWRKQLANGGPDVQHIQQEENLAERIEQKIAATKVDNLNKDGSRKNRECSEQESDAQSSCTRSELEAESKQTNNILEYKQPTERQFSIPSHKNGELNGQTKLRSNNLIRTREDDLSPKKRACLNDNNSEKASRDIELVHIIDNQQKHDMQREVDTMRTTSIGNDEKGSIPAHQLELSLRRTDYGKLANQEKNDRRTLNHSTSSAFSLYNCRTASTLGNAGDGQLCSTSETQADVENKNGDTAAPSHDITGTNRPIRVVPFPVPVQGLTFDGQPFWNGTPVASQFYSQSAPPIWNSKTSMWQESTPQATSVQQKSQQNEPNEMGPKPVENAEEQSHISHPSSNGKQLRVEIPKDEAWNVSPMTGESGTSTVLDSARNTLSVSGCDSNSNWIPAPTESSNAFKGVPETPSAEGSRHLSQREAALNKFRLKRKDRCFEKKVRYQSRKLLAEQRPRVKGQFVRQDHSIQGS
ncbi:two-component response regulator-like PRR95 isoform X2 [Panicum miliaceum]|uniref:Two-component response regulator-like PRR95 isoform X2 n=1 Tax=Panicum miliaceum TaxID=4540 RepID=A0A3L6QRB2_PANMI|nr:two-component response regulator-like PRR95 isoform X2 [Panicum miliaceum]